MFQLHLLVHEHNLINEVQGKVEQLGDKFTILGLLGSSSSTISLSFQATQDIHEINSVLLWPRDPWASVYTYHVNWIGK